MMRVSSGCSTCCCIATCTRTRSTRADAPDRSGAHGFDFLFGDWRVHHRLMRANGEWWEFDGTATNRGLMAGASNVEEHIFTKPSGTTYGVARWEQAYSYDGGKTWATNWIMTFERRS
jgi:hypothetical protein